ncbi:hypothetical protein HPP92_024188 [Vanilla planifolia]|uniref:Pentatricopeptide repeat-containing protein n=1 Tax=Vanilla planifolia TaxID=51239 RepID=A0A835UCQ7_VANPL|nr:hypothetical protein HPP92_024188 [Vanilla planifolia]
MEGFDPDVVTYNTLINGYCRKGRVEEALRLFKVMFRRGVEPDLVSYKILMKGLCKEGRVWEAQQLFDKMRQRGLAADEACYGILVLGYCWVGKMRKAWLLLQEMIGGGYIPDCFVCMEFAKDVFRLKDEMIEKDVRPNQETYNIMISFLCKMDGAQEGECMMEEMISSGLVPDSVTCAALVGGYCTKGEVAKAEYLLKYFALDFGIHDNRSFNTLMKVYCEDGLVEDAFGLQNRMMKIGFVPNTETCKSLIRGLSRSRSIGKLTHGEGHPKRIRG